MNAFIDSETDSLNASQRHFTESLHFPAMALLTIWLLHCLKIALQADWTEWGVFPRHIFGLPGVLTGPLVHGSWGHLASNSVPLFALSALSFYFYRKVAARAFWMIYLLTGLSVWALAREVYHVGASGVVYGLVAFIFWNGIFRRSLRSIILGLLVLVFYSGMFGGILPTQEGVSWESHLLGSFAGIFTSFWYKSELEEDETAEQKQPSWAKDGTSEKKYFLPRDAFDMTKAERAAIEEARRRALEEELRRQTEEENNRFSPPFWTSTWA